MSFTKALVSALLVLLMYNGVYGRIQQAEVEDNDFAEFEDFDDEDDESFQSTKEEVKVIMSPEAATNEDDDSEDDAIVEDEEEFEHLQDEEEFEGFDEDVVSEPVVRTKQQGTPDLKISKIPTPALALSWDKYQLEILMIAGLFVYIINYITGRTKNSRLAHNWFMVHKEMLENNFILVGDDGSSTEPRSGVLMKEQESVYKLWCSGRTVCESMLVTLRFIKRQDLVSSITRIFRPLHDQVIVKATISDNEMDSFVFCIGNKKTIARLQKDLYDLNSFCPDRRTTEKFGLDKSYQMLNEIQEVPQHFLEPKMVSLLNRHLNIIDSVHISDQFAGAKPEEGASVAPGEKVLICTFNLPSKCSYSDMEKMKPLMLMVFYLLEKIQKFRLSRENRAKAEKNRQRSAEQVHKQTHSKRMEDAQKRKETKKRAEKDRIMAEEDPEKQRKLEEKSLKKEKRKQQLKVKTIKMKAN